MNYSTTASPNYHEIPKILFSWVDHTLFFIMLALSVLIGIYYGFCENKQNTKKDYLLGGKTMKSVPIAISLIASHTSGIALLAVPADIYKFGAVYWWLCIGVFISCVVGHYVYLPVFMKLQLVSSYEYLKLRFDHRVRTLASFLFVFSTMLYNPIVIYIPALAFSQAAGINVHLITPIVCLCCIFYTTIGGLKAVVWTDTLQSVVMAVAMTVVLYLGISSTGGLTNIWYLSAKGHRLDVFDFDLDPTVRDSFWCVLIGSTAHWLAGYSVAPSTIQRFLSVPSRKHAMRVSIVFCIGILIIKTLSVFTGLIMFARYADCDPLTTKQVSRTDQLLPYYVMDVAGMIPGIPGLFIAGIFSAGLSTLSSTLNTLSGAIYEDFLSPFMPADISQKRVSNILKLIVVITGVISTAMVYIVEHLGGIMPLTISLLGVCGGPLLGLFNLGMLFPFANAKGALYSGIIGLLFTSWMVFGNQWYRLQGKLEYLSKPLSVDGCEFLVNATTTTAETVVAAATEEPFVLYRISFWYYAFIGFMIVIVFGSIISWFTNKNDPPVHPDLLSPVIYRFIDKINSTPPPSYYSVDKALHLVTANSEVIQNECCKSNCK